MVAEMLKQTGDEYQVESLTRGAWYLSRYADPQDEMGRQLYEHMVGRRWDYVILQDQSFNPVKNYESFLTGAKTLCEGLKPENILFYQTWAYEEGSERLCTEMKYEKAADVIVMGLSNIIVCLPNFFIKINPFESVFDTIFLSLYT